MLIVRLLWSKLHNKEEILALAGCDKQPLHQSFWMNSHNKEPVSCCLFFDGEVKPRPALMTESEFRWQLNENAMASEKLAEGIRLFAKDQEALEQRFYASL